MKQSEYIDTGCSYAAQANPGQKPSCFKCPFKDCIYDLRPAEKKMLLLSNTIQSIFKLIDSHYSMDELTRLFPGIPSTRIRYWTANRNRTERKIVDYGLVKKQTLVTVPTQNSL